MLKKVLIAVLWMIVLIALSSACWAVTVLLSWPLWYSPLIFTAVILTALLMVWAARRWQGWRLRQRMQRDLHSPVDKLTPNVDQCWNSGVRLLRQSRLGRSGKLGSALYALPWFMMLGDTASDKNTLLARSGLATALRREEQNASPLSADILNWWFFENSVVLDPTSRLLDSATAWKRLLFWLLRSRRREPLNGVILVIGIERLQQNNKEYLAELGQSLRRQLDDLVTVFGVRLPVYLILSGAEHIYGMKEWAASLNHTQCKQAVGLLASTDDAGAPAFLDNIFDEIGRRLFELRIDLGQRTLPSTQALHFPERVAALRPALENLLLPAFDSHPYCAQPLLSGLFLTVQGADEDASQVGWFSRELFDRILPSQRFAYRPLDRWRHWHRFLGHATLVLWWVGCGALTMVLIYSSNHASKELDLASQKFTTRSDARSDLGRDLETFNNHRQFIESLEHEDSPGWKHWLPFHNRINQVIQYERASYLTGLDNNILRPLFMTLLPDQLQTIATSNNDQLIASYTELLVRRINLINARLAGRSLDALPGPGEELLPLLRRFLPAQVPSATQAQSLSDSYKAYLSWQTNEQTLVEDRTRAMHQLDGLGLANRSLSWLETWADQQPYLPIICYSDYSHVAEESDATLSRAFTLEGHNAILGFINELIAATDNQAGWKDQREHFLVQYQNDTQDAWYRFIEGYLSTDQVSMASQAQWRNILSTVGTANSPYRQLLQRSAERFALIPVANRKPWAELNIHLNRLLKLADETPTPDGSSLLGHLRVANEWGGDALKSVTSKGSVSKGLGDVSRDISQAKLLSRFNQKLRSVAADLQKSDAQAFQVALDNWGFGNDPSIKSAGLWEAQDLRDELRRQMKQDDARGSSVWKLATGGLDFAMAYAGQIAAFQLQQDWNGQVLGAVESVRDPVLLSDALYGDRGQLPQFLSGPMKTFIQRDAQGFKPVVALGQQVPFKGAFLAYANHMQHARLDLAAAKRQTGVQQAIRQSDRQKLETTQKDLRAQQAALQLQPKVPTGISVVSIQSTPVSINLGARQLPQQTQLTLQCSSQSTVLDNFNFPTSANFTWAPGGCGGVSLEVRFAHYTLFKNWPGEHGFVSFLQSFSSGQRTLTQDDFPDQQGLMASDNITHLTLTYRHSGADTLLRTEQQTVDANTQSEAINERLKTISEQLATMDIQDSANAVGEAAQGSSAERRLAAQVPPTEIADYWSRPRGEQSGTHTPLCLINTKPPPK